MLAGAVVYTHAYLLGGFGGGDVVWNWSRHHLLAGTFAVQCFFVLSGTLITQSFLRSPSLLSFSWHRLLRLAPALWTCLAVTALVFTPILYWTSSSHIHGFWTMRPGPLGYICNNLVRPRTQIAIGPIPNGVPWAGDWNGSLWTLFYEAACYVLVGLIGASGALTRRPLATAGLLGAVVMCASIWAAWQPTIISAMAIRLFNTPGKLLMVYFVAGMVWALVPAAGEHASRWHLGPVAGVGLAVAWRIGVGECLGPTLLPIVMHWLATALPLSGFERRVGGDYSYGLYVYSYPIQQVLSHFGVQRLGFATYLLASLVIGGVFAFASWHVIEKRALRLKSWTGRKPTMIPS